MFTGTLKRIRTSDVVSEAPLRTQEVIGAFKHVPTVGQLFSIVARPIDQSAIARVVHTSIIKAVEQTATGYRFKTKNSVYELEINNA